MREPLLLSGQLRASGSTWVPPRTTFPWPESLGKGGSPRGRACRQEGSPKSLRLAAWRPANNSPPPPELGEQGRGPAGINSSTSCSRGGAAKAEAAASRAEGAGASGRIQRKPAPRKGLGGSPRPVLGPHRALPCQQLAGARAFSHTCPRAAGTEGHRRTEGAETRGSIAASPRAAAEPGHRPGPRVGHTGSCQHFSGEGGPRSWETSLPRPGPLTP